MRLVMGCGKPQRRLRQERFPNEQQTERKQSATWANLLKHWGGRRESNPQPSEPQSGALPVELLPPDSSIIPSSLECPLSLITRSAEFQCSAPRSARFFT